MVLTRARYAVRSSQQNCARGLGHVPPFLVAAPAGDHLVLASGGFAVQVTDPADDQPRSLPGPCSTRMRCRAPPRPGRRRSTAARRSARAMMGPTTSPASVRLAATAAGAVAPSRRYGSLGTCSRPACSRPRNRAYQVGQWPTVSTVGFRGVPCGVCADALRPARTTPMPPGDAGLADAVMPGVLPGPFIGIQLG